MKWKLGLRKWREDRGIKVPPTTFIEMMEEELEEYSNATTIEDKVDALADLIVLASNQLELYGYDLDLVMKEVVKEISSRRQDPKQATAWSMDASLIGKEKWQKDKTQTDTYKANYSTCKIN